MFKDRLKELRISKGLTQEELAEKIHVSRSAICKWEMGNGIPSDPNIEGLCEFFNVEEEWLLDREDLKQQIIIFNDINKKINLTSILGISISIVLFFVSFIGFIEATYSAPEGGAAIMPLIITSIANLLKLKIIPFFLIYFLLMVVSIFSLVKIIEEKHKRKMLILNFILIVSSVFIFLISYLIAINSFVN